MTNLTELRRLHAESTPGEWICNTSEDCIFTDEQMEGNLVFQSPSPAYCPASAEYFQPNAALAVAAHNAMPALLDELEAARKRIEELEADKKRLDHLTRYCDGLSLDGQPIGFYDVRTAIDKAMENTR